MMTARSQRRSHRIYGPPPDLTNPLVVHSSPPTSTPTSPLYLGGFSDLRHLHDKGALFSVLPSHETLVNRGHLLQKCPNRARLAPYDLRGSHGSGHITDLSMGL